MKKALIGTSIFLFATSVFLLTVMLSNSAVPGEALYVIDRKQEQVALFVSKNLGDVAYARTNLDLAQERLGEIKVLTLVNDSKGLSLVSKAFAQTNEDPKSDVNALITKLFEDLNFNLNEVKIIVAKSDDSQLSKEIAQKTTEFSNELIAILPKVDDSFTDDLTKTTEVIDDLDESAVEDMVDELDKEEDKSKADSALSIEKITKKIMKATEKIGDLKEKYADKLKKLTTQEQTLVQGLISEAEANLEKAKTSLSNGEYSNAYKYAKDVLDSVDLSKDKVDLMAEDDKSSSDDDSKDDSKDDSGKDSAEDLNDDKGVDSKDDDSKDDSKDDNSNSGKTSTSNSGKKDEDNKDDSTDDSKDDSGDDSPEDQNDDNGGDDDVKGSSSSKSGLLMDMVF